MPRLFAKISLGLTLCAAAFAECPCDTTLDGGFGNLELGGSFLLWKACVDDLDFAAELREDQFDYKDLCAAWDPGYRFWAVKPDLYEGWDIQGSYTYLRSTANKEILSEENNIYPTLFHPALFDALSFRAEGHYVSQYNAWDVLAAYPLDCLDPVFQVSPFFGVAGIYLTQTLNAEYEGPVVGGALATYRTYWDSALWGAGLKTGIDCVLQAGPKSYFFGNASALLLGCEARRGRNLQTIATGPGLVQVRFDDGDRCLIVPGYQIAVGASLDASFCNVVMGLHLGFEMTRYYNVPNARRFMGDQLTTQAALSTSSNIRTFGFQGIVAGGDILF